jgi:hypothetical protein
MQCSPMSFVDSGYEYQRLAFPVSDNRERDRSWVFYT